MYAVCCIYGDYLLTSFSSVANILYLRSVVVANILNLRSTVANSLYCRGVVIVSELSDENKAACRLHHWICGLKSIFHIKVICWCPENRTQIISRIEIVYHECKSYINLKDVSFFFIFITGSEPLRMSIGWDHVWSKFNMLLSMENHFQQFPEAIWIWSKFA